MPIVHFTIYYIKLPNQGKDYWLHLQVQAAYLTRSFFCHHNQ